MKPEILTYLSTQRVGVLAVEMPDGSPHAATVHFAHTDEPFVLYFETSGESRKASAILSRETTRASFVVGSDESNMKTLQLDGEIRLIRPDEKELYESVYLGKFPKKLEKYGNPKFTPFLFTPTWWRWTDWTTPEGKKMITSE